MDTGSQLPFIREAQSRGFAVLVLNTNQNEGLVEKIEEGGAEGAEGEVEKEKEEEVLGPIRGSGSPKEHGCYVFEQILMQRENLEQIMVIAFRFFR